MTCLALTLDSQRLVSGSQDCNVRLWDVPSQQCVRIIPHKAAITNVLLSHVRPTLEQQHTVRQPLQVNPQSHSICE